MRPYDNNFQVDGNSLLSPDQGVEISVSDLDAEDSGRDESGVMHRIVVRRKVHSWKFTYKVLTTEEYSYIKQLFAEKDTFRFTGVDADGTKVTCEAYCSQNSISLHNYKTGICKNLKFSVIEC